jgi:hypothetical protein
MTDLWPQDLPTTTMTTPLTILREQASLLGTKTKNIVKAAVKRYRSNPLPSSRHVTSAKPSAPSQELFNYSFNLVAPTLDNYTYRLFTVAYDVNLYPATITVDDDIALELDDLDADELSASDEAEFKDFLSRIIGSQKTRKVISALLSQGADQGNDDDAF